MCRLVHYIKWKRRILPRVRVPKSMDPVAPRKQKETSEAVTVTSLCVFSGRIAQAGGDLHHDSEICVHVFTEILLVSLS